MVDYTNRVICFCCGKELTNSDDWVMSFVDKYGAPLMAFPGYRVFCKRCYDMWRK